MRGYLLVAWLLAFLAPEILLAVGPIPPEVTSVVTFIYVSETPDPGKEGAPTPESTAAANGTGFFVNVVDPSNPHRAVTYLVTARHVLFNDQAKRWYRHFFVRLNVKGGGVRLVKLPLKFDGDGRNVFTHNDPSVDLAIIPCFLSSDVYDVRALPSSMVTTKARFKELNIRQGDEVFFAGLFSYYVGIARNYPIVRYGRVALVTDEPLIFAGKVVSAYLVDSPAFGGNSGSPLFFYLGGDREPDKLMIGASLLLAGVVMGTYLDLQPLATAETAAAASSRSSMGISAITPAFQLHDILFSDDLQTRRGF